MTTWDWPQVVVALMLLFWAIRSLTKDEGPGIAEIVLLIICLRIGVFW